MTPLLFLLLLLAFTGAALAAATASRLLRGMRVRQLGTQWGMTYAPIDQMQLAPRVAERFPVAGAADILVFDVLYKTEGTTRHYLFTVEYGVGVVQAKTRLRRAAAMIEQMSLDQRKPPVTLTVAPKLPRLIEQYQHLHHDPTITPDAGV